MRYFVLAFLVAILLRFMVGLHSYSGQAKPPMFGDFEAQRHWMEITTNTPVNKWYKNTTKNDLQYWGLDYPPLTAYHSWANGKALQFIEPESVALTTSRGYESPSHKIFMRASVIVCDVLVYLPAIWYFLKTRYGTTFSTTDLAAIFFLISLQPGLMLIDHGHFQYNSISLGLALWAIIFILEDNDVVGTIFFCLSLNYKQMNLYLAPAFFCYLLGKAFRQDSFTKVVGKVAVLGFWVIVTFAVCWLPFLTRLEDASTVFHRLFPVGRGLYEDKVANFWCSVSPFLKMKVWFDNTVLFKICLLITAASLIPSSIAAVVNPSKKSFVWNLVISGFCFYFFSFQVHEKSVLIPLLPLTLLIREYPTTVVLTNVVASFSMFPLLNQDKLFVPYVAVTCLFLIASSAVLPVKKHLSWLLCAAIVGLHAARVMIKPPADLPDIFTLAITTFSFGCFAITFFIAHWEVLRDQFDVLLHGSTADTSSQKKNN